MKTILSALAISAGLTCAALARGQQGLRGCQARGG